MILTVPSEIPSTLPISDFELPFSNSSNILELRSFASPTLNVFKCSFSES